MFHTYDGSAAARDELRGLLSEFAGLEGSLLPALQKLHQYYGYADNAMLQELAKQLDISATEAASVQSFYSFFRERPAGKYTIRVCSSAPCHLNGASDLLKALEKELGISKGETTGDGKFTLLTTGCIGACTSAPAVMVNEKLYGPVDIKQIGLFLQQFD